MPVGIFLVNDTLLRSLVIGTDNTGEKLQGFLFFGKSQQFFLDSMQLGTLGSIARLSFKTLPVPLL